MQQEQSGQREQDEYGLGEQEGGEVRHGQRQRDQRHARDDERLGSQCAPQPQTGREYGCAERRGVEKARGVGQVQASGAGQRGQQSGIERRPRSHAAVILSALSIQQVGGGRQIADRIGAYRQPERRGANEDVRRAEQRHDSAQDDHAHPVGR